MNAYISIIENENENLVFKIGKLYMNLFNINKDSFIFKATFISKFFYNSVT